MIKAAKADKAEARATAIDGELAVFRPFRAALEAVERDLHLADKAPHLQQSENRILPDGEAILRDTGGNHIEQMALSFNHTTQIDKIKLSGDSMQRRHSMWCSSASIRALSGPLYEHIRTLYLDMCQRDNDATDAVSTLQHERRERINERSSLNDQVRMFLF